MNLTKMQQGERVNLTKENPGLSKIKIGLSWDVKEGMTADLDASVICLNNHDKMVANGAVYYGNLVNGSIKHSGDNRTGEGAGDDETITANLNDLPIGVESLLVAITSYSATEAGRVPFCRVKNASARLYNADTNEALYQFDLTEDGSTATAMEMCKLYKKDGQWRFAAIGEAVGNSANGLENVVNNYK